MHGIDPVCENDAEGRILGIYCLCKETVAEIGVHVLVHEVGLVVATIGRVVLGLDTSVEYEGAIIVHIASYLIGVITVFEVFVRIVVIFSSYLV